MVVKLHIEIDGKELGPFVPSLYKLTSDTCQIDNFSMKITYTLPKLTFCLHMEFQ